MQRNIHTYIHTIIKGQHDSIHYIEAYTDGSKNEDRESSGIAVFANID
jgi:hypothetical protein